ncbi:MAG: transglutaminase domain-containing protein, partial [Clostridiales bacterium]|nr:transglutaminase domain-containing protein [Clostridiales bacterium]
MKSKRLAIVIAAIVSAAVAVGCAAKGTPAAPEDRYLEDSSQTMIFDEIIPLSGQSPASVYLMPEASGTVVYAKNNALIDASNAVDGYVMCRYTGGGAKLKVIVQGPNTKYTYNLSDSGEYETFPLSDGNGTYKIGVYKNISGTQYSTLVSRSITVTLTDEFAPFILPNQYVNYSADSEVVRKAEKLCENSDTELEKVAAVYDFVINTFSYDKEKARTVTGGYLPDVDEILALEKGICFDYSAVMAAMLRSQGIPTKLVVGYAGTA